MDQEDESDPRIVVFMPSLVELLRDGEKKKGSPLRRREVLRIRDRGVCVAMRTSLIKEIEEKRGYQDIDPKNCWEEWCRFKEENGI